MAMGWAGLQHIPPDSQTPLLQPRYYSYLSLCTSGIMTLQSEGEGENTVSKILRILVGAAVYLICLSFFMACSH